MNACMSSPYRLRFGSVRRTCHQLDAGDAPKHPPTAPRSSRSPKRQAPAIALPKTPARSIRSHVELFHSDPVQSFFYGATQKELNPNKLMYQPWAVYSRPTLTARCSSRYSLACKTCPRVSLLCLGNLLRNIKMEALKSTSQ